MTETDRPDPREGTLNGERLADLPDREPDREPDRPDTDLPEPNAEPDAEPADAHAGPLENDDDARWLRRDDPRRLEVERRRGVPFDQDVPA